ncbi:MAG: N-6 DNA methylase [Candidatus Electryonea clarkiae]|nr:N-6 DNA methylase [Candidatus Electryonea clarkiae]MDP8288769.1 N-6 DNA methylase [Candidatus Electryonea clarkiae]
MNQNLEAIIDEHSKIMADQMLEAVKWSKSEEDIRIACTKLIDEFIQKAGLQIRGRHEYGLAGGRVDSKYGGVVIEYKDPKGAGKIIEDKDAPGVKAVVKQIKKRFKDLNEQENVEYEKIFGVGCDGDTFVFIRQKGGKLDVEDPLPVTKYTVQRLLRALVSLGARGLSFTPENLTDHFGADSESAQEGIRLIHDVIKDTENPKAQTFFRQWQILFGEVCGYDIHGQSAKINKLAKHYVIIDPNPAELLFAVHTYYAIFMKMLAAEIVSSFSPLGTSTLKKLVSAPTSAKLRDELLNLEQGGIWSQLGIRNFLEGDIFSWYIDAWNDGCADAVRSMTQSLDQFDPTTLSVDPSESRDLLKKLYQQLFPKSVRHDLGEYYTPDWLAELVLNELGYDGNPDKRLLDPACGSGTFLVMALNRVKTWYDEHRHECGFGEDELISKILQNIIGFDLNPLAVMAARTNYLMAIRDLLRHSDDIELPVYLCDSIMTPSEYGDLFTGGLDNVRQLKTSAGEFNIPLEVAENRDHIGRYANTLEICIRNRYSPEEFLERCEVEAIPVTEAEVHKELYRHLQKLDADNQNGIWARIIKNAFAPLFIGKVDYVAGNPPWVRWGYLPRDYREQSVYLWKMYGLFSLKGFEARLGSGEKDLAQLFTYVCMDQYLSLGGKLGFLITRTVFKAKGQAQGFRNFRLGPDGSPFKVIKVLDLTSLQPFEGASNSTCLFTAEKGKKTTYPVDYNIWKIKKINMKRSPFYDATLQDIGSRVSVTHTDAVPLDKPNDQWRTIGTSQNSAFEKIIGASQYKAFVGARIEPYGVYLVNILETTGSGQCLVENSPTAGKRKTKSLRMVIEPDFIYPIARGKNIQRWFSTPSSGCLIVQDPKTRRGYEESFMKRRYPKTYEYLLEFRDILESRAAYKKYHQESGHVFYSMFNISSDTFAPFKAVWRRMGNELKCTILSDAYLTGMGQKMVIPTDTTTFVPFDDVEEALYFVSLMNSTPARAVIYSYSPAGRGLGTPSILKNLGIRLFSRELKLHRNLAKLGKSLMRLHEKGKPNFSKISEAELQIDDLSGSYWNLTASELVTLSDYAASAEDKV